MDCIVIMTRRYLLNAMILACLLTGAMRGDAATPIVKSVGLLTAEVKFMEPAGFQVTLEDPDGVQNLTKLDIRIGTSSLEPICRAMVDFQEQMVYVYGIFSDNPVTTFPLSNPRLAPGSFCDFGLITWQHDHYIANKPDLVMLFWLIPRPITLPVKSIATAFYMRVEDEEGNSPGWQRMQPFSVGEKCIVRTPGSRLVLDAAARTVKLPVNVPNGCMWSADAGVSPMEFVSMWRLNSELFEIKVENATETPRTTPFELGTHGMELVRLDVNPSAPLVTSAESIVHGANFTQPVAAGSWFSIFGEHLALRSQGWEGADFRGNLLPPGLDGVEVLVNDAPVPVAYVGPGQINALMPGSLAEGAATVQVRTPFGTSAVYEVAVMAVAPGLFAVDYDGVYQSRPAQPGEIISVYGTGFGPTEPAVPDGQIFQGAAPLKDAAGAVVTIGGVNCEVDFIGLSAAGLYQMNIRIPELTAGDHDIRLQLGATVSPEGVKLRVEP